MSKRRMALRGSNDGVRIYLLIYAYHLTETSSFLLIVSPYYLFALFFFPPSNTSVTEYKMKISVQF